MKKLVGLMLIGASCCILPNSAKAMPLVPDSGADDHFLTVLTDSAFNSMQNALYISQDNELLVGNLGVNMYAVAEADNGIQIINPSENSEHPLVIRDINLQHDSLVIPAGKTGAIEFQGREYPMVVRVSHSGQSQYVPLSHIAAELGLDVKNQYPIIYMINDRVVFDNPDSYKVDKNFVLKVELESARDIHSLHNYPELQIVRIYTKTHRNNEINSTVRVR